MDGIMKLILIAEEFVDRGVNKIRTQSIHMNNDLSIRSASGKIVKGKIKV